MSVSLERSKKTMHYLRCILAVFYHISYARRLARPLRRVYILIGSWI